MWGGGCSFYAHDVVIQIRQRMILRILTNTGTDSVVRNLKTLEVVVSGGIFFFYILGGFISLAAPIAPTYCCITGRITIPYVLTMKIPGFTA